MLTKNNLFNPNGDDRAENKRMIGGNSTNLFNLNETKYKWAKNMFRLMNGNFWLPEKVDMGQDKIQYSQLTETQQNIYKSILSFLTFLDSIQTNNIPNIQEWITSPEIKALLSIQQYQETIHSASYAYIIESVIPQDDRNNVYELWRDNELLLNRNKIIASFYQDFIDHQSKKNFYKSLIANYILESVFFYNGFVFFYSLAKENKMMGTADQIRYISGDEMSHTVLFANIINEIKKEEPDFISDEEIRQMFEDACDLEFKWNESIFKDYTSEFQNNSIPYVAYLANQALTKIGVDVLYKEEHAYNPYKEYEKLNGESQNNMKSNFFESTVTNYTQSSTISGWDF